MIRIAFLPPFRPRALLALLLACAWPVLAEEAAVTRRATELRESPAESGRSLAALPAQAPLTRLDRRQGPWVQVRAAHGATGWVHLFDVAPANAAVRGEGGGIAAGVGDALRGVTGLFGRTSPQPASTAAGIRGLGAEDLAQAQPDPAAVTRMESWRQSDAEARGFAGRSALQPVAVEPLPAPARPADGAGSAGNPSRPDSP